MAQTAEANALTPYEREKMCTSKRKYPKESRALDRAVALQRKGSPSWVYRCIVCGSYHVAARPRALSRPPAANG